MSKLLVVLAFVAACGGKKSEPMPPSGSAAPPAAMTPDECTAKGGHVKGDIGDGKVACDPSEQDLGRVNQGIEGAVCCTASGSAAP